MKIAITGKGGVGKTTLSAALAMIFAERGKTVLAVDADPDSNLASALGIPSEAQKSIVTIAKHRELIEERTGAGPGEYGRMFKLNPEVDDIADAYSFRHRGVSLLVLGAVKGGGTGCACPESALLRALVQNMVLRRDDTLIMDMEAGIEHLGRATAGGVDALIAVVEPGQRAVGTLERISRMAAEIGVHGVSVVLNGVRDDDDVRFLTERLSGYEVIGTVPYSEPIRSNDRDGRSVLDGIGPEIRSRFEAIADRVSEKILDR